jgi:rhodanese-related sulfurtransferase
MNASLILLVLAAAFIGWMFWRARPEVTPEVLRAALQARTAILIDVREPSEWAATGTARDAVLLPLSDLHGGRQQWGAFLQKNRDKLLCPYCQSGTRSAMAAATLRREGLNALNAGSLAAIDRAGCPLGRKRD